MTTLDTLEDIAENIRTEFERKSAIRDATLSRSRELIRLCAATIRASHRGEIAKSKKLLAQADQMADTMRIEITQHPDLYFTGYTQDALKELAEAHITLALARDEPLPTPQRLQINSPAYLNGLAEAASEMRRRSLDLIRADRNAEAERLLAAMDEIYGILMTFDFPDAVTGGLRRRVDQLRGVLERTRGDLTMSVRQDALRRALHAFEEKLGVVGKQENNE